MEVLTFGEMDFRISANELMSLLYRAKQSEVFFKEKVLAEAKIVRLEKEYSDLKTKHENMRKEVIKMPVKWTKPKKAAGTEARKPESKPKAEKPKGEQKPKANKPPKGDKPNGEKEAK